MTLSVVFDARQLAEVAERTFVFEGVNGSGKSTAIATVAAELRARGLTVHTFRDPGSHPTAQALRLILKNPVPPLDPVTQTLLFTVARRLLLLEIVAAYTPGSVILIDRWIWSTLVYQCAAGVDPDEVVRLYRSYSDLPLYGPGAVTPILLDIDAKPALLRSMAAKGQDVAVDRFESAGLRYLEQVVELYRRMPASLSMPSVDATQSAEAVASACLRLILSCLYQ